MSCCGTCVKVFLVLLNCIIGFFAILFIAIGAALEYGQTLVDTYATPMFTELTAQMGDGGGTLEITEEDWATIMGAIHMVAIPLMVAGIIMFAITFTACCGVCCSSKTLLLVYSIIISLLTVVFIIGTIWIYVKKEELIVTIEPELQGWVAREYVDETSMDLCSLAINFLNIYGECCGIVDYLDFDDYPKNTTYEFNGQSTVITQVIPATCCKGLTMDNPIPGDMNCTLTPTDLNTNMNRGCYSDFLQTYLDTYSDYVIYAIAGFLVFMGIITLLAWLVCCSVANKSKVRVTYI